MSSRKDDAERLRNLKNDYRAVFFGTSSARQGERVLQDLLNMTGMLKNPFIPGQPDLVNHRLGQNSIGHKIIEMLDVRGYDALRELEKHRTGLTDMYVDPYAEKER